MRRGLAEQGFVVEKRPGHGRKRERLEAHLPSVFEPSTPPRVAVIGAGVAGASVACALYAQGVRAMVFEGERPGAGGSGFPAALVTPRLDAGDHGIAALHAQALERAGHLYASIPDAVTGDGVLQLPQAPRDAARFEKIARQPIWNDDDMAVLDEAAASAVAGEATGQGGLLMKGAFALRPAAVLSIWLADAEMRSERVIRLERADGRWRLIGEDDAVLGEVDAVVLAAGWGSAALLDGFDQTPRLSPVRGQADWIDGDVTVHSMAWGGYAVPTGQGLLFGATHDRGDTDTAPREDDSARNLATLEARLPALAERITAAGTVQKRAAVRATTPDRLPVAGALDDGLYVLGGLGSRGFCVAPLLGEHVAAVILDQPSPLPRDLASRVSPRRSAVLTDGLASFSPTRAG